MQACKTGMEQLNIQNNVEESTKTTSLQTNEQYGKTPLWIRGNDDTGYYVTIGAKRITDPYITKENVIKLLKKPDLELILNLIVTVSESTLNILNELNKTTTNNETTNP